MADRAPGATCDDVMGSRLAALLAVVLLAAACGAREARMRTAVSVAYDPASGRYASLDDDLFGDEVVKAGMWKPERFAGAIGFGIYLAAPHDPDRLPVLLVHGHAAGPRVLEGVARVLDSAGYEPWFAFYPTGLEVARTAALMRESLARAAADFDVSEVAILAHSMGGLVARAALGATDDGAELPRVPVLITLSTPWAGSERAGRWAWSPAAPPSWKDMKPGSTFLAHLFDAPLPEGTALHVLYGTRGDSRSIPGDDDTVVSLVSVTRAEALAEASSVAVFDDANHMEILSHPGPVNRVLEILGGVTGQARDL
jgi:hypothetical protein